mgnify:FL=1
MEKSVHISMLLEMYGKLLTDKQQDVIDLYYNQNLSLSEIAEELNITRQGVRKSLIDAENRLFDIEEKLGLLKEKLERDEVILKITKRINDKNIKDSLMNLI